MITTGGAPTPANAATPEHFPQTPSPDQLKAQAPQEREAEKQPSLAELIRAQREAREAKAREEARNKDLSSQLEEARKEIERLKKATADFEDDPIGFGKNRGWTREQQLFYGQTLLYDLAPDQAPPDFREKLFEMKLTRRERAEQRAREEAEKRAQQEAVARQVQAYYQELANTFSTVDEGSYPESTAWFTDPDTEQFDRDSYLESLMHTANNLAEAAAAQNKVADLSPANVAKVLEAEVARRMALRDRRASARKTSAVTPEGSGEQSTSLSTRNMMGSGTPRPPAMDDEERIQRAAGVVFRTR